MFNAAREWASCKGAGHRLVLKGSPEYPPLLGEIQDPPEVLYVRGVIAHADRWPVAIVGARRATPYGLRMARQLGSEAARAGLVVVSGLARGIDAAAHQACLDAGGTTWAVLGTGIDEIYPKENAELAERIVDNGGALLSEAPLGSGARPEQFPRRNRIISGLSYATIVVEGNERSGSLITARFAAKQGREVFAVPGSSEEPLAGGPIRLLKDGAGPITTIRDLYRPLWLLRHAGGLPGDLEGETPDLTPQERKILELMGPDAAHLESLLQATGWGIQMLSRVLLEMELKELIAVQPGQRYAKR